MKPSSGDSTMNAPVTVTPDHTMAPSTSFDEAGADQTADQRMRTA